LEGVVTNNWQRDHQTDNEAQYRDLAARIIASPRIAAIIAKHRKSPDIALFHRDHPTGLAIQFAASQSAGDDAPELTWDLKGAVENRTTTGFRSWRSAEGTVIMTTAYTFQGSDWAVYAPLTASVRCTCGDKGWTSWNDVVASCFKAVTVPVVRDGRYSARVIITSPDRHVEE
jgi:hypothetical protein